VPLRIEAPAEKLQRLRELRERRRRQLKELHLRNAERWQTAGQLAAAIDPETVQTPALDVVDEALAWAYSTRDARLIISLPPQEGKSSRVTKTGSLWALIRNPDLRLGIASYAQSLAEGFGRDVRNLISTHNGDEGTLDLGLRVARDYGSARRWQLEGHRGGIVCVGIGSGLTGRPLDCFTGATDIPTDRGYIRIRDVYQSRRPVNVLSWNHAARRAEWKPVVAARRIADREVVEVVTAAGRRFTCTPDHRIYTADGYRPAALLRPGDALTVGWLEGHASLHGVREGQEEHGRRDVPGLRRRVRRGGTLGADDRRGKLPLQDWRQLCRVVSADAPADQGARSGLPGLPPARQAVFVHPDRPDGHADEPARAPHRRAAVEQPAGEPDPVLQVVPPGAPQVGRDTVSVVRRLRGERHDVYDIQVAGNHNFFAGEVLAHNCLVIDDPFADQTQADSPYYRERVWSWWQSVGAPRLAPGSPAIVILTRWHQDDLAGRLQTAEDGHRWRVINIPALADHDPAKGQSDPLGREPGEWLQSARGRTAAEWEQIRIQAGSRVFTALYQGRPSPDAGNVWQRQWWRRYHEPLWSQHPDVPGSYLAHGFDEIIVSVDAAFKDTKSSDYVVIQVWARRGASVYLLYQVRKRLSFTDTVTAFTAVCAMWPQASRKLVEDTANGTAVIDSLKAKIPGIVPVTPHESKYARASAVSPFIEAGNVFLPAPEVALFDAEELVTEAAAFPNGSHDDQVDATSQALAEMLLDGTGAQAWIAWAKRKAEAVAAAAAAGEGSPGQPEPDDGYHECARPDCARRISLGAAYCCPACAEAAQGQYEIQAHGEGCDDRDRERGATASEPEPPAVPADHATARKLARDVAFRAQQRR
jgi:predicted phage terminase large subunit-like protein